MNSTEPIKRDPALQPFSRDHHYALLLCFKIKSGFQKGISTERIKKYADWFYQHHLLPHFELEEKYMFPLLGSENDLVKKAIEEHMMLTTLFTNDADTENSLKKIQTSLEEHIRFEERTLFSEIQKAANDQQLKKIEEMHSDEKFADNVNDEFWK